MNGAGLAPSVDVLVVLVRALVALGPLVIVPIGLEVTRDSASHRHVDRLARAARRLLFPSAVAFAVALMQGAGPVATALTAPWLFTTVLVGLLGAARLVARGASRRLDPSELAIDVGYMYLTVGGAWALVSRADVGVLGFAGTAALLTAAHFHYAGFGACVLVGTLGRRLGDARDSFDRGATVIAIVSVALVAAGITLSRTLEKVSAATLVVGVALTARMLWRASRTDTGAPRVLARVSAFSGVVAASFAAQYTTIGFAGLDAAVLRRMLFGHATVNVVGFIGAGLVSRWLARRASACRTSGTTAPLENGNRRAP